MGQMGRRENELTPLLSSKSDAPVVAMKIPPRTLSRICLVALLLLPAGCSAPSPARDAMQRIAVATDGKCFVLTPTGQPLVPWGFNYDHDEKGRLLEDYWEAEWPKVEADFREMRELGANVIRIHLQFGRFMRSAMQPDARALRQLRRLLVLAEREQLRLDLTGLACYHKRDVPPWYDVLEERERWAAQARFWEAIAKTCADNPAVFCYDLMNEPVVAGGQQADWLGPPFAGKHFVQFITRNSAGRAAPDIARQWIQQLVAAIRQHDKRTLVTVGLVDWSLDRPGLRSGFVPEKTCAALDFVSVHLYPEKGKLPAALETLRGFAVSKPVLIEETFPLKCGPEEFSQFLEQSRPLAAGWIGFYWGKTPEECRRSTNFADALMLQWLDLFQHRARAMQGIDHHTP
jgi:hypothetical protein